MVLVLFLISAMCLTALLVLSCTNVNASVYVWPSSVRCDTPVSPNVVLAVDDVLGRDGPAPVFSEASIQALEDIAREARGEQVVCALSQLAETYKHPKDMMPPPAWRVRAMRAEQFLAEHDIRIAAAGAE